jgi:hypothetical protein
MSVSWRMLLARSSVIVDDVPVIDAASASLLVQDTVLEWRKINDVEQSKQFVLDHLVSASDVLEATWMDSASPQCLRMSSEPAESGSALVVPPRRGRGTWANSMARSRSSRGSSRGVGLASARLFPDEGAHVVMNGRKRSSI